MAPPKLDTSFRPDVEGLRALAVFAVILFHYSNGRTAGFVGVDIFFVISGFLITRIIAREIVAGQFQFSAFYARRARRIIPALVAVVLFTVAGGLVLLSPPALVLLGKQAISALFGVSNVYFWLTSGYFSREAHSEPLLHTWSLGVEEQFYLLWPMALLLLHRIWGLWGKPALLVIGLFIALSFGSIRILTGDYETFAFFMLPTRAWQLATGGLLVFLPSLHGHRWPGVLKAAGLFFILAAILLIEPDASYPGFSALLPTVGAALLIWPSDRRTYVADLLSIRPLRYFGKISYSLYLWHWPPLVLLLTWSQSASLSLVQSIFLFLFAWAMAQLSWRFVEQPFRQKSTGNSKVLVTSAGVVCVVALIPVGFVLSDGAPARISEAGRELSKKLDREEADDQSVFCDFKEVIESDAECDRFSKNEEHVLVMGDSHADHLVWAIKDAFPAVKVSTLIRSGCRPIVASVGRKNCVEMYDAFFRDVLPDHRFDAIVLSARWRNGQYENLEPTVAALGAYADRLVVLGQTVEYDHPLPELLLAKYLPRRSSDIQGFMSRWAEIKKIDEHMARSLSDIPVEYYSVIEAVCPDDNCTLFSPSGYPLTWDYGHFNASGARLVVERLQSKGFHLP